MKTTIVARAATISDDQLYRYTLLRTWDMRERVFVVIGLNPSTADATQDDPTIRRCIRFAQDHDCGGLVMLNLFAFRATKPADLWKAVDPIGPRNTEYLRGWAIHDAYLVAAWGKLPMRARLRVVEIQHLFNDQQLYCLDCNADGSPKHPLYIPADRRIKPWPAR